MRDTAFLDGLESLCGVEVRPLCLERLIILEQAQNGLCVPYIFENEAEMLAHALQVIYYNRPAFTPPSSPHIGMWASLSEGISRQIFIRRMVRRKVRFTIIQEVQEWISDAFMDAPSGNSQKLRPSYASYPVYIFDLFAEAGLNFTYKEVMQMPLRRLWQYFRIANRRLNGVAITNPSDNLAVAHVANNK